MNIRQIYISINYMRTIAITVLALLSLALVGSISYADASNHTLEPPTLTITEDISGDYTKGTFGFTVTSSEPTIPVSIIVDGVGSSEPITLTAGIEYTVNVSQLPTSFTSVNSDCTINGSSVGGTKFTPSSNDVIQCTFISGFSPPFGFGFSTSPSFDFTIGSLTVNIDNAGTIQKGVAAVEVLFNFESIPLPETPVNHFYDIRDLVGNLPPNTATIHIQYTEAEVAAFNESTLVIYRFTGGAWVALPTTIDTVTNTATAPTPGFSAFALGGAIVSTPSEPTKKKTGGGGCSDCEAPTLGLNKNFKRVVDNGFSYNGNVAQVGQWHTPYPLINATVGDVNTVEIVIFENQGISNIRMVQFGLGAEYIGQPLSELEVLVEVPLITNGTLNYVGIGEINIRDKDNLIENSSVTAVTDLVQCMNNSPTLCAKVTLQYSYREATINHAMVVDVSDNKRNNQEFTFNHGVQVVGDSLNEPPTHKIFNKISNQQTENLWLNLVRTDKVNNIWTDQFGIEYLHVSSDRFDRITPAEQYKCTDPALSANSDRNNCNFRNLTSIWSYTQQ